MQKIDDLKKIDDLNLIHFRSIDQNFTVNCKSVGKIAVSIIKAALLVSALKTTPPICCNIARLPFMLRLP